MEGKGVQSSPKSINEGNSVSGIRTLLLQEHCPALNHDTTKPLSLSYHLLTIGKDFGLVSLFNGILTYIGYLMINPSF